VNRLGEAEGIYPKGVETEEYSTTWGNGGFIGDNIEKNLKFEGPHRVFNQTNK